MILYVFLYDIEIDPKLLSVGIYTISESALCTLYSLSDWFDVNVSVRQGSVLSLLLFLLCMEKCIMETGVMEDLGVI